MDKKYSFMAMACLAAQMSHCTRYHVGCLFVKDNRPIVTGINGTLPGVKNCDELFKNVPEREDPNYLEYQKSHGEWSRLNEIHAEMNAISYSAKHGIPLEGSDVYITLEPCIDCSKILSATGINRLFYLYSYDRKELSGLNLLQKAKIPTIQLSIVSDLKSIPHNLLS